MFCYLSRCLDRRQNRVAAAKEEKEDADIYFQQLVITWEHGKR